MPRPPREMADRTGNDGPDDDTFTVPVEWPRGAKPARPESAYSTVEGGATRVPGTGGGGGGSAPIESGTAPVEEEDDDSDDGGFEGDDPTPSSSSPGHVKWKLALLFLSSIYELISIVTKTRLFLAINEIESCYRCGYPDDIEDLASSLFISSMMFFVCLVIKEAGKVAAAFLHICCECDMFFSDETVWPRNVFTPLMYLIKPTVIVPSYAKDYEYEYSQSHTLLNLCVEDLPFLIIGIYARGLEIGVGFGALVSAVGVLWDVFEAVQYLRKN